MLTPTMKLCDLDYITQMEHFFHVPILNVDILRFNAPVTNQKPRSFDVSLVRCYQCILDSIWKIQK